MNEYEKYTTKAYKTGANALPVKKPTVEFAKEQYPSRKFPNQGGEFKSKVKPGIKSLIKNAIKEDSELEALKKETAESTKPFRVPGKWRSAANKANKTKDLVAILFLNIKGEIEPPILLPIYGNMVLLRNKVYEVDPRAFWILRQGGKMYKFMIIKEIDRRPVSNLDWDEIKKRGDATDSDEFLIKMALRAQQTQTVKSMSKGLAIIIGLAIVAAVAFFFFKG